MPTLPTTPPLVGAITVVPNRATDATQAIFSANTDTMLGDLGDMQTEQNLLATWENDTGTEMYANAVEAADSAINSASSEAASSVSAGQAETARDAAQATANFKGNWSDATGAASIPSTYFHEGNYWQLLTALGDVTSSEPSATNADYALLITSILPEPDVSISFNDGIQIEKGYGTFDTLDVSDAQDESVLLDLPTKSVDFTRASGTGNINKSGVSVELLTDEPAITSDGLSVYESYSNELLYSEDFSNVVWAKSATSVVVETGFQTVIADATTGVHRINQPASYVLGDEYTFSVKVRSNGYGFIKLELSTGVAPTPVINVGIETGEFFFSNQPIEDKFDSFTCKKLSDGFAIITCTYIAESTATLPAYIYPIPTLDASNSFTGDGVSGIDIAYTQLSIINGPYIKTTSAPVTRAADIVSIPIANNLPLAGKSFTVVFDADVYHDGEFRIYFRLTNNMYFRVRDNGVTQWSLSSDIESTNTSTSNFKDGINRVVCVYDEIGQVSLYSDGILLSSSSVTIVPPYLYSGNVSLGTVSTNQNTTTRGFTIYHSALSAAQIAQLGSA